MALTGVRLAQLVNTYGFDGIRVDTVPEVRMSALVRACVVTAAHESALPRPGA